MVWGGVKHGLTVLMAVALVGGAWAQSDGKISDSERAKRDAEKVFSFIKFHTVKPAAAPAPARPAPAAARPAAPAAPARSAGGQGASSAAAPAPVPLAQVGQVASEPVATRSLEPAAPPPPVSASQPLAAPVNTLPPAAPASAPVLAPVQPEPEPEPEPEEVPLKLEQYVAPEMTRQVLEAIGGRDHVVPIRFTVEPNGVVSKAEPREGANRRLGLAAARAVQQWRFGPLPERRVVDVELLFRATSE